MSSSRPSRTDTDPLSEVLATLGARSLRRTRLEAGGDWALRFPARERLKFVAVLRGRAWMLLPDQPLLLLSAGDVCLLGRTAYTVAAAPGLPASDGLPLFEPASAEEPAHAAVQLGGDDTAMLGGGIAFADDRAGFLLDALPGFLRLPPEAAGTAATLLQLLEAEILRPHPGSALVTARLADILLVAAIRAHAAGEPLQPGWIGALGDPPVGRALRLMHAQVAQPWTVESLARAVGQSRSGFAARFTARVGRPPLDYLRHWRMVLARAALRDGGRSVAAVAEQVGYASQSAFAQAFRRSFGHPPGAEGSKAGGVNSPDPPPSSGSKSAPAAAGHFYSRE